VVEVRVGQHDRLDVAERAAEPWQRVAQRLPRRRHAGVDHGQTAAVLDDVPVGVGVGDPVDAVNDVGLEHGVAATA
jgi:hypothetical protein